jgi:hypothetical protein
VGFAVAPFAKRYIVTLANFFGGFVAFNYGVILTPYPIMLLLALCSLPTHPQPSGGFPALSRQLIPLGRPHFEERMDLSPDRVVGGLAQGAKFRRFLVRALDRIGFQAVFHDGRDPIRHGFQKFEQSTNSVNSLP